MAALIFAAVGLSTLGDYGITIDEPENFLTGERTARFWLSFDPRFLTFAAERGLVPQADMLPSLLSWEKGACNSMRPEEHRHFADVDYPYPWVFPPLANTLSGFSCLLFFHNLGWLEPVHAHHLPIVLFGAGGVALIFYWSARRYGVLAGISAALLLAAYPRFFTDSHNNVKDLPETVLFAASVLAIADGVERASLHRLLLSGVVWGLALAVKPNAVFVPFVLAPWTLVVAGPRLRERSFRLALLSLPFIAALTVLALWPYLWLGPTMWKSLSFAHYYYWIGRAGLPHWKLEPAAEAIFSSPIPLLLAGAFGLAFLVNRRDPTAVLLGSWLVLPIFRVSVPTAAAYNGIRQYMEFVPALAILGGIGIARIAEDLGSRIAARRFAEAVIVCAFVGPCVWATVRTYPHQLAYFNELIGGFRGAVALHVPSAADYWASSAREAVAWLNENAEPGSRVAVPWAAKMVWNNNPRRDLVVAGNRYRLGSDFRGYVVDILFFPDQLPYFPVMEYCEKQLRPVHTIEVEGAPLINIFRVEPGNAGLDLVPPGIRHHWEGYPEDPERLCG